MIRKVLITAGPTREMLDPIRFISNRSTGEMGYALAKACKKAGYRVTLVSGPTALTPPRGIRYIPITNTAELQKACGRFFPTHDALIMSAAVSDYRPRKTSRTKMARAGKLKLTLEPTPDIVAGLAKRKGRRLVIGFCLETQDWLRRAKKKCVQKGLDGIVANQLSPKHNPFGKGAVRMALVTAGNGPHSQRVLPRQSKNILARAIIQWMDLLSKKGYRSTQKRI